MSNPTALSNRPDNHTRAAGYANGAPEGRQRLDLDDVIEQAIDQLPMAARLYPEVYAWAVSDAVLEYLGEQHDD